MTSILPVSDDVLDDGCVVGDASVAHLHVNYPKELAQTLAICCLVHSVQIRFYKVQLILNLTYLLGNFVDTFNVFIYVHLKGARDGVDINTEDEEVNKTSHSCLAR